MLTLALLFIIVLLGSCGVNGRSASTLSLSALLGNLYDNLLVNERPRSRADRCHQVGAFRYDAVRPEVKKALHVAVSDRGKQAVQSLLLLGGTDRHPRVSSSDVFPSPVGDLANGGG